MSNDTIAAIASGLTASGISIIRISGKDAVSVASRLFRVGDRNCPKKPDIANWTGHTVHYGFIVENDRIIDEVMLLYLPGPKTFTREDTIEIDCHGGIVVTKKILSLVLANGARLAEPGEFTKRAFLNGRIDLSQAEAVMDIISAKNELALKNSVKQLRGRLREKISVLREQLLSSVSRIEASLDQPEYYSLEGFADELSAQTKEQIDTLHALIRSADNGRLMSEGIHTVILGKPNVGKSSLMNALLGEERAIVTDIAGTTRDTLSEEIRLNGITLIIVDTAGIRDTADPVEKIGVMRAREQATEADLIVYVADASAELDERDEAIIREYGSSRLLAVLNKSDLTCKTDEEKLRELLDKYSCNARIVSVSAKKETGLDALEDAISALFFFGEVESDDEVAITSERQKQCLIEACESLRNVLSSIGDGMPEDFLSIDLMSAYGALSRILGEEVDEDLINRIFRDFCLGK